MKGIDAFCKKKSLKESSMKEGRKELKADEQKFKILRNARGKLIELKKNKPEIFSASKE